jgi:hypothetical protein
LNQFLLEKVKYPHPNSALLILKGPPKTPQVDSEELESCPSLTSWASKPETYQKWVPYPIPNFPLDAVIEEWNVIAQGAHGQIRRIRVQRQGRQKILCLKLFTEEWKDMYEHERKAYMLLIHHGVKRCIPAVYFKRTWPRWRFDGNQLDDYDTYDREETMYGLFMEYFEDCREIELRRASIHLAEVLGQTLEMIHEAGVVHNDLAERNILLVRDSEGVRIVWIDFSCAWSGKGFERTTRMEWNSLRGLLYQSLV